MANNKTYAYLTTRIEQTSKEKIKIIADAKDLTISKLLAMYIEEGLTNDQDIVTKFVTKKFKKFKASFEDNPND